MQYTEEQLKDIQERSEKAIKMLAELELSAQANVSMVNLANDVFGVKVQPLLMDTKYASKNEEVKAEESQENKKEHIPFENIDQLPESHL